MKMSFISSFLWEHFHALNKFDLKVVEDLVRAASEYIINGPIFSEHFDPQIVNADQVHIIVENLTLLFLECCRNNINEEKLYQFLELKQLNSKYAAVIVNEYQVKKNKIHDVCAKGNNMLYYHDLQWRLEAKVGSRSLPNQMVPLFSMDLKFGDTLAAAETVGIRHEILQADAATLSHVADTLAKASSATRSRHFRKIRKEMKKLSLDPQI